MLFVWSFGTRQAEVGYGLGSIKEALLSWGPSCACLLASHRDSRLATACCAPPALTTTPVASLVALP